MEVSFEGEPENPKLLKLQEILVNNLVQDANARGIMFVRTRELAQAIVRWVNETPELDALHASEFVGQNAKTSSGGRYIA